MWSPAWLRVSLTTTIGEKRTFDASATPKVGDRKVEVRALTPIDIAEISRSLADVVERAKADDPRELRRRIAELERQLKAQKPTTEVKIVEKPILTQRQVDDLVMVASKLDLLGAKVSNASVDVRRVLNAFNDSQRAVPSLQALARVAPSVRAVPTIQGQSVPVAARNGAAMPGGHRRILLALARYGACDKSKLAILARYASNGGGFNNNLSALRTAGRIEGTDLLTITPGGREALGGFDPLPEDADQLFDDWLRHPELGRAHREVMRVLRESDRALSKEDIAAKCDPPYEPGGGGFNNALSRLRTLGIIEGRSEIELTEQLRGA